MGIIIVLTTWVVRIRGASICNILGSMLSSWHIVLCKCWPMSLRWYSTFSSVKPSCLSQSLLSNHKHLAILSLNPSLYITKPVTLCNYYLITHWAPLPDQWFSLFYCDSKRDISHCDTVYSYIYIWNKSSQSNAYPYYVYRTLVFSLTFHFVKTEVVRGLGYTDIWIFQNLVNVHLRFTRLSYVKFT